MVYQYSLQIRPLLHALRIGHAEDQIESIHGQGAQQSTHP